MVRRLPSEVEAAAYYCCMEAVQNALKHAGSDASISIRLVTDADGLQLEVRDDGLGFDVARTHNGVGLENMRDRLGAIGGSVMIVSEPGQGTLVAAKVPVARSLGSNTKADPGYSGRRTSIVSPRRSEPAPRRH
jgi:signal transduction histidine kinase